MWDILRRHRVRPHPAYYLRWSRVSCKSCILGSPSQWATVRRNTPERFREIGSLEQRFGVTIHRSRTVERSADIGQPFVVEQTDRAMALAAAWTASVRMDP